MNIGYCKDCRFWTECNHQLEEVVECGICFIKAFVQDFDDYSAVLITLSDFGCVQFESKSEK
jgi:hypothetical protein